MLRELWKELVLTTCWVLTGGPWCGSLPLLPGTPVRFCGGSRSRGSEGVLIWAQAVVPQPMLLSCSSHGYAPGPEFCPGQQRVSTVPPCFTLPLLLVGAEAMAFSLPFTAFMWPHTSWGIRLGCECLCFLHVILGPHVHVVIFTWFFPGPGVRWVFSWEARACAADCGR